MIFLRVIYRSLTSACAVKKMPFHPPSILVCMDTDDVSSGRGGSRQSLLFPGQALYCGDDLKQIVTAELISGGSQPRHCIPNRLLSVHEKYSES